MTSAKTVDVPMMHQADEETQFKYFHGGGFKALEMPYRGEALSMIVLLPDEVDGLAEFENRLSSDVLAKCIARLRVVMVPVTMPKFTLAHEEQLGETLAAMGMLLAFDMRTADFRGMREKNDLFIAAVIQKALVDVSEEGTEAAAVTVAHAAAKSAAMPNAPEFTADHPFIFLIRDTRSGCILFLGRVVNPKE